MPSSKSERLAALGNKVATVTQPFTLAANLAHYVPAAITEAGQIMPVFAQTLGFSGVGLPTLTGRLDVAQFLQGVTLLSAMAFSPYPLLRITKRSWLSNIPHLLHKTWLAPDDWVDNSLFPANDLDPPASRNLSQKRLVIFDLPVE